MSDDASASARLSGPYSALSEADYARMRDALTETTRGRWFLDEFARRNRTADTRMVLEAISRIESVVAAQQTPPPLPISDLPDRVRDLVQRARSGLASMPPRNVGEVVTQAQRGTRIIREIAWQMRACGNDPRICNILDAQLEAIDAYVYAPATDSDGVVRGRFETLLAQLDAAIGSGADVAPAASHELAEDDAVLERIAAEMASDDEPGAAGFEEPHAAVQASPPYGDRPIDSLGEMLIARGIVRAPGGISAADRELPSGPDHRIN